MSLLIRFTWLIDWFDRLPIHKWVLWLIDWLIDYIFNQLTFASLVSLIVSLYKIWNVTKNFKFQSGLYKNLEELCKVFIKIRRMIFLLVLQMFHEKNLIPIADEAAEAAEIDDFFGSNTTINQTDDNRNMRMSTLHFCVLLSSKNFSWLEKFHPDWPNLFFSSSVDDFPVDHVPDVVPENLDTTQQSARNNKRGSEVLLDGEEDVPQPEVSLGRDETPPQLAGPSKRFKPTNDDEDNEDDEDPDAVCSSGWWGGGQSKFDPTQQLVFLIH